MGKVGKQMGKVGKRMRKVGKTDGKGRETDAKVGKFIWKDDGGNDRKADAYFTVEAALVMPFVIGAVLVTVYLLFFQYDRCLMEQNAGKIILWGCARHNEDNSGLVAQLSELARQKDERYLSWKAEDTQIVLKGNRLTVQCSGELIFPFSGELFGFGDGVWESEVSYEGHRVKPVNFIRNCKRITGGK
ncbi:MAG: hypothetical protein NC399_03840 [Muribaculum sp.]|nr:hypothetical protein [Muribaculum sp.]